MDELNKVCAAHGFSVDIPWKELTEEQQNVILFGSDKIKILFGKHGLESRLKWKGITAKPREEAYYKGMIPIMEEILKRDRNDNILRFAGSFTCGHCHGSRLRKEALSVHIAGKNISELSNLSLTNLHGFLANVGKSIVDKEVYDNILNHVFKLLEYLKLLGLEYLTLMRESTTLSGGESHRIRLASQVGSGLQGILYILDEPSIGLHYRDNKKLLKVLKSLRDNGNTLLVVEHDEETIKSADYLIDIGPKAGVNGGEVVYQGDPEYLFQHQSDYPKSITAQTISMEGGFLLQNSTRSGEGTIHVLGATKHNLKNIDVDFKLNAFNVVTGVSGAGKSTLVHQVLGKYMKEPTHDGGCLSIESTKTINRIIEIDQSPIGRTPRSNPATYTDLFDHIRDLFASLPASVTRGYKKGRFSFNNTGGRCETCMGAGTIQLGMHFLGDVEIVCEACNGMRFNEETLEVYYHHKNIFQVLELSIEEALEFFKDQAKIVQILDQLVKLDVGYLKLGQPSTTLSGGEAQRVKLASELYKTSKGHTLYLLDEPTVGLHKADIAYLLEALNSIVNNDNTVVVIEQDLDVIGQADWITDLGPEGGDDGGYLVKQGTPIELMDCKHSFTGLALKERVEKRKSIPQHVEKTAKTKNIRFFGVTTNNLKHIDVEIPLNKITVITGISGSGKSSLAFDTLYAESRNRFTESLSTYARRMMSKINKPELEQCSGLTPAIAIRQNRYHKNPRSTVGTATGIYDLYRLLLSRAGVNPDGTATIQPASMFSFNKPEAAFPECKGLGIQVFADPNKFITSPGKPITGGAMDGTLPGKYFGDNFGQHVNTLLKVGEVAGFDFTAAFTQLSAEAKEIALYGTGDKEYDVEWNFKRGNRTGTHRMRSVWKGMANYITEDYEIKRESTRVEAFKSIISQKSCPYCHGGRLNKQVLEVTFDGMNISQLSSKTIKSANACFKHIRLKISNSLLIRCDQIIFQLVEKLATLENIGLGYLSIDRPTSTLSGGEAQRLRISTQLVSDLCGLTYVLDEPTVGLHSRDTQNLMNAIKRLNDNGNSVVMVEHDPEVISLADHIIDLGPGAGEQGGEIIAQGNLDEIKCNTNSVTGRYLNKAQELKPKVVRPLQAGITVKNASANNLKNIALDIPSGGIVALTGVSGSGKTSLAFEVIGNSYVAGRPVNCQEISFGQFKSISVIDQQRIGTSPISTPATYTGLFDLIRDLFANLPI
ncbi:MAG: excinuclease ABC subunit A, partial [Bacteroidetes bacterium CG_4_10_14_3_um_filter_42_6]